MYSVPEIRFDGWTLLVKSGELVRDGKTIRLQDQPLLILRELLAHPHQLVRREELIALLWPRGIVEFDTALNSAVRRLRIALGDEAETPRYIETIPRRGYRFIGSIDVPEISAPTEQLPAARPRHWWWTAVLLVAAGINAAFIGGDTPGARAATPPLAEQPMSKSIAVLPFLDLSATRDQQYFADGLAEEVLNLLAQAPQLRVIARTSSFTFRGDDVDIATIAQKLQVTHVLEGSIRRSGDRVRITAQLIDARTSAHIWSQNFDRDPGDLLTVQGEIATAVAAALEVAMTGRNAPSLLASAPAYEHLMQGNFFYKRREPGDLERAEHSYRKALEIDPRSGRIWASLASVYWIQTVTKAIPNETGLEKVRQAAKRALELDPTTAEAHMRLANYSWATGRDAIADEHVRRAAELDPNNSLVRSILASVAAGEQRFDEAIALMRANVASDPLSFLDRYNLGSFLFFAERFGEARFELSKAREISTAHEPDLIGLSLILERKFSEGLAQVQRWPDGAARAQCLAMLYHALGRTSDADAALAHLVELAGSSDPFRIAEVHAYRGDADAAFEWMQLSLGPLRDEPRTWPTRKGWLMRVSPFVKTLRGDARWDAWVAATRRSG